MESIDELFPLTSTDNKALAERASRLLSAALAGGPPRTVCLRLEKVNDQSAEVELPTIAARVILEFLRQAVKGRMVRLLPLKSGVETELLERLLRLPTEALAEILANASLSSHPMSSTAVAQLDEPQPRPAATAAPQPPNVVLPPPPPQYHPRLIRTYIPDAPF